MPRACTVCSHAERPTIDQELADAIALRDIAQRYDVSKTSLLRHQNHRRPETDHEADQAPAPPSEGTPLDLDAVNDAMWTVMDMLSDPLTTVHALRTYLLALGRVVHELIVALDNHHNCP